MDPLIRAELGPFAVEPHHEAVYERGREQTGDMVRVAGMHNRVGATAGNCGFENPPAIRVIAREDGFPALARNDRPRRRPARRV